MKNSIKRAQSQACLGFAEQKNFRPLAKLKKLTLTLALLITAATGAWAQGAFSSDPYTSTTEFNRVSVTSSMTLNINEGVIVTVNSGLTIEDGVTLTLTGGGRLSVFGESGDWGRDASYVEGTLIYEATAGGDGKPAIILNGNAKIVIDNGEIYAEGGPGGRGGTDETAGINKPDGAAGNAFSRFPTIDGATLYYNSFYEWIKCTSGDQTLYNEMKAVPATFEVTIDNSLEQPTASFQMPQYDLTATYTLKRDMTVDVDGEMADRIRIQMVDNAFQAVDATQMNPVVKDNLETNSPVTLTVTTDYTLQLQKQSETDETVWTDVTALSVGNFRYKITGAGNYSGICYSEEFALFEGYEIKVATGEYATFYKDEPLYADTETSADAVLYTISSVSADKAVLSSAITTAPSLTPLLVFNSSEETKTFLLIPADAEPNLDLTVAPEFKGTLEATTIAASTDEQNNYALNGKQFVWVKDALAVNANKAWLAIPTSTARQISIVFGDATSISAVSGSPADNNSLYTLDGRKVANGQWSMVNGQLKKGVYILNGKKVVVK